MVTLKIKNLIKSHNGRRILENLNLDVKQNEIVIISGKSGSGKTTMLLSIVGFIKPDSGEMVLDGKNIISMPMEERQMAYVPQDYGLFPHLTVQENIAFGLSIRKIKREEQNKKVWELLKAVELPPTFAQRSVEELSGGEKQRVALARALAIKPKLFLLDEPLSAVDIETRKAVGKELRSIIKKLSIPAIIVSHDIRETRFLGDVIYELREGKLKKVRK